MPQVALKYSWTIVVLQSSSSYLTKHWLHKYMHFLLRHRMIQRCLSKVYLIPSGNFCFTNSINMLFTSILAIKELYLDYFEYNFHFMYSKTLSVLYAIEEHLCVNCIKSFWTPVLYLFVLKWHNDRTTTHNIYFRRIWVEFTAKPYKKVVINW